MNQENTGAPTAIKGALCLNDLDGVEMISARMPTPEECRDNGLAADVPVLVLRFRRGEQVYPADRIVFMVDQVPPPAPEAVHRDAQYVIHHILEDLQNAGGLLSEFGSLIMDSPRKITEFAGELRQQRADEVYCNEPCRFAARQEQASAHASG